MVVGRVNHESKEWLMSERQIKYRLRKDGYFLRKRGDAYMIIDGLRNWAFAGGDGNGFGLTLDEVSEYARSLLLVGP